jgi:hypothetical protein
LLVFEHIFFYSSTIQQMTSTLSPVAYRAYFEKGVSYEQYIHNFEADIALGEAAPYHQYLPMNHQRVVRIYKNFAINADLQAKIEALEQPLHWLVISEPWCGDASQIVPVLARIAEASNGKIGFKIAYRDQNLELIDAHLTGTSRSIPKLVQLNADFNPLADWGARPQAAQDLVVALKSNPETAATYSDELHKWYAKDKQTAIQAEIMALLG